MKACPICSRTYGDDTLTFCLDDGARLSAPLDSHSTLRGPAARDTDPPRTEILHPKPSVNPALWIILSGTLALLFVGLVIALGYLAWKANRTSTTEPSSASSTAPTSSNPPANANRGDQSNPADDSSLQWLDGTWKGEGYQSDTKTTWQVRLKVQDGTYVIEYPNIPCQGIWKLIDKNSGGASFTEVITAGTDLCSSNSHVMIEKISDSEISCKYTHASSRNVIATATLSKKAQSNEPR